MLEVLVDAHKEVAAEPQGVNLFSPAAVDHLPSAVVLGLESFSMKDRMQPGDLRNTARQFFAARLLRPFLSSVMIYAPRQSISRRAFERALDLACAARSSRAPACSASATLRARSTFRVRARGLTTEVPHAVSSRATGCGSALLVPLLLAKPAVLGEAALSSKGRLSCGRYFESGRRVANAIDSSWIAASSVCRGHISR